MGEMDSIASNRKFMDHYYMYYKTKEQFKSENCEDPKKAEYDSCKHYLLALNECIRKIQKQRGQNQKNRDYLDFLRWNYDIIKDKLCGFKSINESKVENLKPIIELCEQRIDLLIMNNLKLSEIDNAIINEYIHVYEFALSSDNQNPKVYKQAARLYINYINLLKDKRFVNKTDKDGLTFTQLDSEAIILIEKLSIVDKDLSADIKLVNENYADFRQKDNVLRAAQDLSIKDALVFAHKKSTETFLEGALRRYDDAINLISKKLQENKNKVMDVSSVLLNPIRHPIESCYAIANFFKHPLDSVNAIWNYAKENPWKMAAISIGGIILGAVFGGVLTVSGAFVIDAIVATMAITSLTTWGVIAGVGSVCGMLGFTHALAGSKIVELKNESNQQIAEQEMQKNLVIQGIDKEGEKIARQVLNEERIRQSMREARESTEEKIKLMEMEEEMAEQERNRQINEMNDAQLLATHSDVTDAIQDLTEKLHTVKEEINQKREQTRQMNAKILIVSNSRSTVESLMQDIADRNKVSI